MMGVGETPMPFALGVAFAVVSAVAPQQAVSSSPESILEAALAVPRRRCSQDTWRPNRDPLHILVSGGRALIPLLVERFGESTTDANRGLFARALSFLALPNDDEAIEALLASASDERFLSAEGLALLRIGGRGARRKLDALAQSSPSADELASILGLLWTLREVDDLEHARAALVHLMDSPGPA